MLESKRLYLRSMEENDLEDIIIWRNNPRIREGLFSYQLINKDSHLQWYRKNINKRERIDLIVCKKEDDSSIGTVNFSNLDFKNQKAEFGLLFREEEWGKGYAFEAVQRFFRYGFEELNLNRIYVRLFVDNQRTLKLNQRLNLKEEGLLREEVYKRGRFRDVKIMSILKRDWLNND